MRIHAAVFTTSLLLVPCIVSLAGEPITIPMETYKVMRKGKRLNLVWQASDFDGTQGFQLGKISNESEDEAGSVLEDLPIVLRRQLRAGSPYVLHLAVTGVRNTPQPGGTFNSRVDVEGRVVDRDGRLVAALETRGTATIGGNKRDNLRFALNDIAFGLAKDLFTAGLPGTGKSPAVIVAAPDQPVAVAPAPPAKEKPSAIIVPAPTPVPPAKPPVTSAAEPLPPVVGAEAVMPGAEAPKPVPPPPPAVVTPPPPASVPPPPPVVAIPAAPAQPPPQVKAPEQAPPAPKSPLLEALPPTIAQNMKRGSALDKLWIGPDYDRASGFSIGEVRYLTDQRDDIVAAYLPDGLAEISRKDAPCVLHLGITALTNRAIIGRSAPIRIKVEGRLVAKDGTIVAAFASSDSVQSTDDRNANYRELARAIVVAIGTDLR